MSQAWEDEFSLADLFGAFCWDALDIRQDPDGTFHWTGPASPGFGPTDLGRTAISFRGTGTEASA